jgi:hypothetical protein
MGPAYASRGIPPQATAITRKQINHQEAILNDLSQKI